MEVAKWSDYQSIISTGIALNAAFAAVSTFLPPKVKSLAELLTRDIRYAEKNEDANKEVLRELRELESSVEGELQKEERVISVLRFLAAVLTLVGIGWLSYTSVNANSPPYQHAWVASLILNSPFCLGVIYMLAKSFRYSSLYNDLKVFESKIQSPV